jgi:hypothetical protein
VVIVVIVEPVRVTSVPTPDPAGVIVPEMLVVFWI